MESTSAFQLLPTETRQEIFKNLNKSSLFKCLLVDRQWCREIVPILWEKPFPVVQRQLMERRTIFEIEVWRRDRRRKLSDATLAQNEKLAKIVNVYVGLFSKNTWKFLNKHNISRPRSTRAPTFNYASFLRHYEFHAMLQAAGAWLQQKIDPPTTKQVQRRSALVNALCQLLLIEAKSIQSLYHNLCKDDEFWSRIPPECSAKSIFKNLKELRITGITNEKELQKFLEEMADICHSIRGITIFKDPKDIVNCNTNENTDDRLKKAIKAQNELRWLELNRLSAITVKLISSALCTSSSTLRAISFYKIDFNLFRAESLIEGLSDCVNLFCLDFYICSAIEQQSWLETAKSFKKLEFLSIEVTSLIDMPLEFIKQVIECSGDNLKHLLLREEYFRYTYEPDQQITEKLLSFVLLHTQNLHSIDLIKLNMEQAAALIASCPKLEHLNVYSEKLDESLNAMTGALPARIRSLGIYCAAFQFLYSVDKPLLGFLDAACGNLKYLSVFLDGIDDKVKTEIKNYGIEFTQKALHDRIYPYYFPRT